MRRAPSNEIASIKRKLAAASDISSFGCDCLTKYKDDSRWWCHASFVRVIIPTVYGTGPTELKAWRALIKELDKEEEE